MRSKPFALSLSCRGAVIVALLAAASACSEPAPETEAVAYGQVRSALTFMVTNSSDSGMGSLRYAIETVNASGGGTIVFDSVITTIALLSPLPAVTAPNVTIDGIGQAACPTSLEVELDGSAFIASTPEDAAMAILTMQGGNGLVRGLVFTGTRNNPNTAAGLVLDSDGNKVQCNFFGTDTTGMFARSNNVGVLIKSGTGNIVGVGADNNVHDRNLISGQNATNFSAGVRITGGQGARVSGNLIGGRHHRQRRTRKLHRR